MSKYIEFYRIVIIYQLNVMKYIIMNTHKNRKNIINNYKIKL